MDDKLNFIAIDFETATGKRASICEVGICVVRNGEIIETKSWLVQPEDNAYSYWNIQIHGILVTGFGRHVLQIQTHKQTPLSTFHLFDLPDQFVNNI